ncbi:unnamed protein product [Trichogramma brassicae]|uniref:Uncharacterized protein n=1 Tax=Trichogramma brassicae TaxID=86971 RepID=A0A6H5IZ72_9HYME|nr:unnamed protein product [Trichogramma brassicae]
MGHTGVAKAYAIARRRVSLLPTQPLCFGTCSLQAASALRQKPTRHCQEHIHFKQTGIGKLTRGLLEDAAWYRHSLSQHPFTTEVFHTGPAMSVLRFSGL